MRWAIALSVSAVLGTASFGLGYAAWTGNFGHRDHLRVIHYDTHYDLSSQRRIPVE